MRGLAGILAAAALLWAAPAHAGQIGGVVVAAQGGEPLASVQLSLSRVEAGEDGERRGDRRSGRRSRLTARSGLDGRFVFPEVEPGDYVLGAYKAGFEGGGQTARRVTVDESDGAATVDIELNRSPAIEGRVVDADGEPLADAKVEIRAWTMSDGRRLLRAHRNTQTDDLGEYRHYNLPPGRYLVYLHPTRLDMMQGGVLHETAGAYYPQGSTPAEAAKLDLDWGAEMKGVDFVARPAADTLLSGTVLREDGTACGQCSVAMFDESGLSAMAMRASPSGRFVVQGLESEQYSVTARGPRGGGLAIEELYLPERRPVEVALQLVPGQTVSGVFSGETEDGEEAAFDRSTVRLLPADRALAGRPVGSGVGADGRFRIKDTPLGLYDVFAYGIPSNGYVRRVLLGGRELPGGSLRVTGSGPVQGLEVEVAFDGGSIQGRAVGEDRESPAPPDGIVVMVPLDAGAPASRQKISAYNGNKVDFQFRGVPPGEYLVFSAPRNFSWDWSDPALLAELRRRATRVEVDANQIAEADAPFLRGP